jgi:hypothetical protein
VVRVAFGLRPPRNTKDFFGPWQRQVDYKLRSYVCVGASAIIRSIWFSRNDVIFDKKRIYSYLQVIFSTTYWTRFWSILEKENDKPTLKWECRMLETASMEIFAKRVAVF